jgi:hypothetical protein
MFGNGSGYYNFYSIAVDNASNNEIFTVNDTVCGFDNVDPSSSVDDISVYWQNTSELVVNVTASDSLSGVNGVTLYWFYSSDNVTWFGPFSNGTITSEPYSWTVLMITITDSIQYLKIMLIITKLHQ